ncbi:MAG: hypothetical protein LUC44_06385, partial [Prevotellaceae bacterium]|nr:hypothetical protein [Prevotellaceae bacterium]
MRKLLTLSIVALLTMFSTSAFAAINSNISGKMIVGIGDPISSFDEVDHTAGHYYLILTNYSKYDSQCLIATKYVENVEKVRLSDGSDLLTAAQLSSGDYPNGIPVNQTTAGCLIRFLDEGDGTYAFYVGFNHYFRIHTSREALSTRPSSSGLSYNVVYNINGEPGHFGFYGNPISDSETGVLSTTNYRICAASELGEECYCFEKDESELLNGPFDFSIVPVTFSDEVASDDVYEEASVTYYYNRLKVAYDRLSELSANIEVGDGYGQCTNADSVAHFTDSLSIAADYLKLDKSAHTSNEWEMVVRGLYASYEKVANNITNKTLDIEDGYYRFVSLYLNYENYGKDLGMYYATETTDYHTAGDAACYDMDESDPAFLWKVEKQDDGNYLITNASNGYGFNSQSSQAYASLSENGAETFYFTQTGTGEDGSYHAYITTSNGYHLWSASTNYYAGTTSDYESYKGQVMDYDVWTATSGSAASMWELIPVSDSEASDIINGIVTYHSCEADLGEYNSDVDRYLPDHWTSMNSTSAGNFHINTWSSEDDPSGMVVPFVEYWYSAGNNLPDDVLYHDPITGLTPGETYQVSIDMRAFNESGTTAISAGTTFNVNDLSLDINAGTATTEFNNHYELYGTLTLFGTADSEGTLDINFSVSNANYNWIVWKNLKVTSVNEIPALPAAAEGDMDSDVAAAQEAAIAAFNADPTYATYNAAVIAIAAAHASANNFVYVVESPVEDGMYIVQNVETGQYLGGGNTWGTHASVLPLPQQFTLATQEDGKYTLASYQYNGTKHFL